MSRLTAVVIVTFNPDDGFASRLNSFVEQSDVVVIVDNASNNVMPLRHSKVLFIRNEENLGIATALNLGIKAAVDWGADYICLFDQDSSIGGTLISELRKGFYVLSDAGIVAANYISAVSGRLGYSNTHGSATEDFFEIEHSITSGSMLSWRTVVFSGLHREDLFIDYVDIDYCEKVRLVGLKVYSTKQPLMEHSIGQASLQKVLWRTIATSNHSPLRRYYMIRNCTRIALENLTGDLRLTKISVIRLCKIFLMVLMFERERARKVRAMILGLIDGFTNKMGKTKRSV